MSGVDAGRAECRPGIAWFTYMYLQVPRDVRKDRGLGSRGSGGCESSVSPLWPSDRIRGAWEPRNTGLRDRSRGCGFVRVRSGGETAFRGDLGRWIVGIWTGRAVLSFRHVLVKSRGQWLHTSSSSRTLDPSSPRPSKSFCREDNHHQNTMDTCT